MQKTAIIFLFLLASCNESKKPEVKPKQAKTQETIIENTSGEGNVIIIQQSDGDSSIVEINGHKWVNGVQVK